MGDMVFRWFLIPLTTVLAGALGGCGLPEGPRQLELLAHDGDEQARVPFG